jgi:glutaredoxin 3
VPTIVIYSKSWCPYCTRAKALLRGKGAAFEDIDVEAQPDRRAEMIERSGRRSVPQIFIDGRHIGGCDDLYALEAAGGLDPLLSGSNQSTVTTT